MATQKETARANFILDRAAKMLKAREQYDRQWTLFERIFKMVQEKRTGDDEWRAVLPDTWAFATIKTAQSAFADGKVIPTIIRHQDDPSQKAEDTRDLYTTTAEKGNLDEELTFARLDTFKLGIGWLKTIYSKETRTVWDIERYNPKDDSFSWKKRKIDEFDDPKTVRVSPYLVLVDDLARFGYYRDLIEVEVLGRDEAEERYGHLINFKKIEGTVDLLNRMKAQGTLQVAETDGTGLRGTEFEELSRYSFFAPGFDWSNDYVEVLHYWNQGIRTPSGALDSYEVLINGIPAKVDLANDPSPIPYIHKRIPFTAIPYAPYSKDEFYSAGIIEIGIAEADAIKKHREMMSDRQLISLFSPAFSDVNDEIDQKQLKLKPLSIIRTKGGVPRQFNIPGITSSDLELLNNYELSYKRATGIDERILGVEAGGPRLTATEVSFLREAALKRLREFSFYYKNALLHGEIRFKLSLFKQYYSSPLKREAKLKNDSGTRSLKAKYKEFKVRNGNVYTMKEVRPNFFEADVDVDLDLQLLLPMTQSQLVTLWSQVLRDSVPFVQAGIVDISLSKVFGKYLEALGTNIDNLRENRVSASVKMAESEHQLFANPELAKNLGELLPEGTEPQWLSREHLLKHNELLDADIEMNEAERIRLLEHIKKDTTHFNSVKAEAVPPPQIESSAIVNVGGLITPQSTVT